MSSPPPPSGEEVLIRWGDQEVSTCAVAAGLRSYTQAGRALVDGFDLHQRPDGGRGQTLIPWPNRIDGGRYQLDGPQQLALTEPRAGNAIHGLARQVAWSVAERSESAVTWGFQIAPQPGWPTWLSCRVRYAVDSAGLTVTTTARNIGASRCFYGTGAHPYLRVPQGKIDAAILELPASSWFSMNNRNIPQAELPVVGHPWDFRAGQVIGDLVLDHAFGQVERAASGRWTARLRSADTGVALWADEAYGYLQVFSGDTLAPQRARTGLAIEPMTCPPNAVNFADPLAAGVILLEPGAEHRAQWGIYAL